MKASLLFVKANPRLSLWQTKTSSQKREKTNRGGLGFLRPQSEPEPRAPLSAPRDRRINRVLALRFEIVYIQSNKYERKVAAAEMEAADQVSKSTHNEVILTQMCVNI